MIRMARGCCGIFLALTALGLASCSSTSDSVEIAHGWILTPPRPGTAPVSAITKLPGIYPVGSRIKDDLALGGFAPCDNYPKELSEKNWGTEGIVSIVAFPDEPVACSNSRGFALRVVNRSDAIVAFDACDSELHLVCEAQDTNGVWRDIETAPQTTCGNSYHRVFLPEGQYWEFPARLYSGSLKTRLRFRLDPGREQRAIYTNEFDGQINPVQFENAH